MPSLNNNHSEKINNVIFGNDVYELILGDCQNVLKDFPDNSIDCVVTSPPYWKQREYDIDVDYSNSPIGEEDTPMEYVARLKCIFAEIYRVLKPSGSLWLNIGDKYNNKNLAGIPWRVAISLQDDGWILRNDIVWEKMKGTQSAKDRFRTVYEHIFYFVKSQKYYFNPDDVLVKPRLVPTISSDKAISATGVSGKKYRTQIAESSELTSKEKAEALAALDNVIAKMRAGEIVDFRMTIRGNQRTLHSNNGNVSGRAKELEKKGYFVMMSHSKGYMPSDIWRIAPEDEIRDSDDNHYAVFPVELLEIPLKSSCPSNGIVLDPFSGTGSTVLAARKLGRKAIGIDVSKSYIKVAERRLSNLAIALPNLL